MHQHGCFCGSCVLVLEDLVNQWMGAWKARTQSWGVVLLLGSLRHLRTLPAAMLWHFKEPVMITSGKMQYLYDETGRRYLDV